MITFDMEMCSLEGLKQDKKFAKKDKFSGIFIKGDEHRYEQEKAKESSQKAKKGRHQMRPEGRTTFPPLA